MPKEEQVLNFSDLKSNNAYIVGNNILYPKVREGDIIIVNEDKTDFLNITMKRLDPQEDEIITGEWRFGERIFNTNSSINLSLFGEVTSSEDYLVE